MHQHGEIEHAENHIRLPFDIDESRGDEVSECEIESPVRRRGERNSLAAHAQRVEFWGVNPRDGTPGWGVGGDEEVGAGDDGFGGGT